MNKYELLQLEKMSLLTPNEIKSKSPELFTRLSNQAGISLKNTVKARLNAARAEIKESLTKINFSPDNLGKQDVKNILTREILDSNKSTEHKLELEKLVTKLPSLGKLDEILQPELPVFANPAFQKELMKAKFYRLGEIAGLTGLQTNRAVSRQVGINSITSEKLELMVAEKILTKEEAKALSLSSNLLTLLDSDFELTAQVKASVKPQTLKDLVALSRQDWLELIKESKTVLPDGIEPEGYAEVLYKKAENLFPETALEHHLNKLSGIELEEKQSQGDRGTLATERINLFRKFTRLNSEVNYLSLNYRHDSDDLKKLDFSDMGPDEKKELLNLAKSYQKIYSITKDVEDTVAITGAGFSSYYHITSVTLPEFMEATKLDAESASRYVENANTAVTQVTGAVGSIIDIVHGGLEWTEVDNINTNVKEYLREIPGYEDLFGSIVFNDSDDCQTIYSPSAYYVDLMKFVKQYVLSKYFKADKEGHVLNLKVRRPDLWTLPLTKENTNTLVSYLEIINEILEAYLAKVKGFTGDLNDRNAVEEYVFKRVIALEKPGWKDYVQSFKQPYHLPITAISTYLGHFEKTREDVAILLNKPLDEISRAGLNISVKEYDLITAPNTSQSFIEQVYDIEFTKTGSKITPFDVRLLAKTMGVDRIQLGMIFSSNFVTNHQTDHVIIQGEKSNPDSVQNDIELISNLTFGVLDKAHRFVRLWRKTDLSIKELDLVLTQLKSAGIAAGLNQEAVTAIGSLLSLRRRLKITPEELSGIWYRIPEEQVADNQKSLFDSLFNHEDAVAYDGAYPKNTTKLIHPALVIDRTAAAAEFTSDRLITAFNRSDDEILELIRNLSNNLGIVALDSGVESDRGFYLTNTNLSLLYRHSKLAEIFRMPVSDFFRLIKLVPGLTGGYVEGLAHINKVLDFYNWWKASQYTLDDLNYITGNVNIVNPGNYKKKEEITTAVIEQTKAAKALLFADTVFTYFNDVTEEESKAIINMNKTVIELSPDNRNYWLKPEFNTGTLINVPAGINRSEAELRDLLIKYHPKYLLPYQLSGQLKLPENTIIKLAGLLGIDFNEDAFMLELKGAAAFPAGILRLVERLLSVSVLLSRGKADDASQLFVLDNMPVFQLTALDHIAVESIQRFNLFLQFINTKEDGSSNLNELAAVIKSFNTNTSYQTADQKKLAQVLQTKPELLTAIHMLVPETDAITALQHYKKIIEFCSYVGIGGEVLENIVSSQYDDLNLASQSILAVFRSKYKSEEERREKLSVYQDNLLGWKRDAITDYLIHSNYPQFKEEADLFNYFLIDTELEGCARTSRLVAATMSVQLYVHRILLNLEQDGQEPGTPGRICIAAGDIPGEEWEWRKNYRVWEANRKVFLYPENYIEPDLRGDKSQLFKELESELLQKEINSDNVLDAYAKYMRGFDEVAHLKIAGSYHEKDSVTQTDVLHLFGVTAGDPPVYYYRAVENIYYSEKRNDRGVVWGTWQKINVQIPVRNVAPITYNGRLHIFWIKATTMANTVFEENKSVFVGYDHKFSIEFTTLKLDGTWTPPQKINLRNCYPFDGNGVLQDPLAEDAEISAFGKKLLDVLKSVPFFDFSQLNDEITALKTPRYDTVPHYEAKDEYTLQGFLWDQVYPTIDSSNRINLTGVGYQLRAAIDFYNLNIQFNGSRSFYRETFSNGTDSMPSKMILKIDNSLYRAAPPNLMLFDPYAYCSLIANTTKENPILNRHWQPCTLNSCFDNIKQEQIAYLPNGGQVQVVNGAYGDSILDLQGDLYLLQGTPVNDNGFILKRLSTTLSETLTRTLFTSGVDTTLSIKTQLALKELAASVSCMGGKITDKVVKDKIDFTGPYGTYYREIFFHIPFLIANHLNSQGKYADAQKWYHYIFNPTASETIPTAASGSTLEQKKKMERDRNWQYREFREIEVQKLKEQLIDKHAIEAYKKDPFNPHSIANLRFCAYQKCIIMKYIDNLLDWGDQLFTQDTMESINEATLLYITAKDILGDRPYSIKSRDTGNLNLTYEKIEPLLDLDSEFLIEMETYIVDSPSDDTLTSDGLGFYDNTSIFNKADSLADRLKGRKAFKKYKKPSYGTNLIQNEYIKRVADKYLPNVTIKAADDTFTGEFAKGTIRGLSWLKDSIYVKGSSKISTFSGSLIKQISPVFSIPGNKDLLGYYDRVDDRLYKIRNCLNILGQKRQLALFAPEIDPRFLIRAKAAGLTLDDILSSVSGNLPPYRFSYILERAKALTSVVQSFGASLLSAIEKKDGEELTRMRMTQQQNILKMASKSRRLEIDSAYEAIKTLNDKLESLNYQVGYYQTLYDQRINGWETAQSIGKHGASIIRGTEATISFAAGILKLLPDMGSPFAMKYGGLALGGSMSSFAFAMTSLANLGDNIAASAGLEAVFERRRDGWDHQKKLLKYELKQTEKNLKIAEIRRDILIEAEKIHQTSMDHNQEVMDFYGEKFTNLGLYTWLSASMQRLYKDAFNNALSIARLAEQAYRYERDDDNSFIDSNYYESSKAGLLAGDRLLLALQTMERRYLETNYRKNEIDQAFSLTQIDPAALLSLKQKGSCSFSIPEIFFDLFYPGQYRRKIQSVRLTIPSITGPYTNVSATLSLMSSQIRMEPKLGMTELRDIPKSRTTTIATSTAQNDAGVFQINFRDDRFMPFEGAGAISTWKLSLPNSFRQFDYNTINDVIIHVSYTAEYDELFRNRVEEQNDAVEGTLLNTLKNDTLMRAFSLRQEFSTDFQRLIGQPLNTPITIQIQDKHFPLFLSSKNLQIKKAYIILVTANNQTVTGFNISINGIPQTGFAKDADFGELYAKNLGNLLQNGIIKNHTIAIIGGGDLAPQSSGSIPTAAVDSAKLKDIVICVEYGVN